MELTTEIREALRAHADACYPQEACGLIVHDGTNLVYRACANTSIDPTQEFRVSPQDWLAAEAGASIVAVFHSHPDGDYRPSQADQAMLDAGHVPWVIMALPSGLLSVNYPSTRGTPLLGRQFQHGFQDCFTLLRDYYRLELKIALPDVWHGYDWWKEGANLYLDHCDAAGFRKVDFLQKHDVVLMTILSPVPNHVGIYVGDGMILHHFPKQLSRRDLYGGLWQRATHGFYRHRQLG